MGMIMSVSDFGGSAWGALTGVAKREARWLAGILQCGSEYVIAERSSW